MENNKLFKFLCLSTSFIFISVLLYIMPTICGFGDVGQVLAVSINKEAKIDRDFYESRIFDNRLRQYMTEISSDNVIDLSNKDVICMLNLMLYKMLRF